MRVLLLAIFFVCLTQIVFVEALFGLAGLVALKAGAVGYAIGRNAGRRRGYGGYGHGHGYNRGYHHGGYNRGYRWRRDVAAAEEQEVAVEAAQLDAYFTAVAVGDEDQCGLKLVCHLHATEQQSDDANMIRALFGSDVPSSGLADSPKLPYDEAAALGRSATSATVCAETFNRCSLEGDELLEAIQ